MIQVPECQNHTVAYWRLAWDGRLCLCLDWNIFYIFIVGFSLWGPEDGEIVLRTYEDDLLVELKVIRIHQDIECLYQI